MDLQKRLQNKLDWLKSTKGIKTADAKLTIQELETIVGLMNADPAPVAAPASETVHIVAPEDGLLSDKQMNHERAKYAISVVNGNTERRDWFDAGFKAARSILAAPASGEAGAMETEQSIAADCYHTIAEKIGTKDGYSVQEHVDCIMQVLQECSDYFHNFAESDVGGDDEGVHIAANLRAVLSGKLQDVTDDTDAAPIAADHIGDKA